MTTFLFRWKLLSSVAICCLIFANASLASSDLDSSLRLSTPKFPIPNAARISPGKTVCSLAGSLIDTPPAKIWSALSSLQLAPTANTKPVDIAVDQFSSHKFGQIGFTPQCLFVDHSVPRGYLETKIAGTFEAIENPIYDTCDIQFDKDQPVDRYWEYYSDCDSWNVVFKKLPQPKAEPRTNHFHEIVFKVRELAATTYGTFIQLKKHMEFVSIETQGINTKKQASEIIIERVRSLRPVIFDGCLNRDFVVNWLEMKQCWLEAELHATPLAAIWNRFPKLHLYDQADIEIPPKTLKTQLRWIAHEIEELLTR